MEMLIVAAGFSLVFLLLVAIVARSRAGAKGVAVLSMPATLFFVALLSPALALQCLSTFVLALVCAAARARPRTTFVCAVVAAIGSFALVAGWSTNDLARLNALRRQYPLESIDQRLAFESSRPAAAASVLAPEVDSRLRQFESTHAFGNYRADRLRRLHDRTADRFVVAQGFGPVRMDSLSVPPIELPSASSEVPCNHYTPEQSPAPATSWDQVASRPTRSAILATHDRGALDLLNPARMGYVRDRQHVAGFEPHQFTSVPTLTADRRAPQAWQVVRMELVGLLRHDQPVAYVTRQLPRLDMLAGAPTRALDAFERDAIDKLRADDDLVIDDDAAHIRMVGSLRASRSCLECHAAQRGELLGAISYELAPREGHRPPADEPHARLVNPLTVAQLEAAP